VDYNCFAWALRDSTKCIDPDPMGIYSWPEGIQREYTLESFIELFRESGFEECDNSSFEKGYEKVAIYLSDNGTPIHAARQVEGGKWTSKLGDWEDIVHELDGLEGTGLAYGQVAKILKRKENLENLTA